MDVCIIGCGNQGGCFAALLAMEPSVGRVVLADLDRSKAEQVEKLIRETCPEAEDTAIEVTTVNAMDPEDVARAAKGCGFIFNGILPFCNISVMKGALLAGAHYMDLYALSADLGNVKEEETIEAQLAMDEEFRKAGLAALPSEGVSPGWVNLAAKYITDQMDEVEEIGIRSITWLEADDIVCMGPDILSVEMSLHLEPPSYYQDGRIVPLEGSDLAFEEEFIFPAPAGRKKLCMESVSCVEALIRQYTGKPVGRIYHRDGIFAGKSDVHDVIYRAVQKAVLAHPGREMISIKEALAEQLRPMANVDYRQMIENGELTDGADTATVIVFGKKDGQRIRHEINFNSTLHEAVRHLSWVGNGAYSTVGSMPVILFRQLADGSFTQRGVIAPGLIGDARTLFAQIEAMGHPITEKIEKFPRCEQ